MAAREVRHVNYMDLVRALMQVKGATPANIIAVTEVEMNKTHKQLTGEKVPNPYHGRVTKKQDSGIFINYSYENAVNKRLLKEGKDAEFEAQPRKWGERLPGTPLVFHKNVYYLTAGFITKKDPKVEYMVDGVITEKAVIEPYLKPIPTKEAVAEKQGLNEEDAVIVRDFLVSNIREITVGGVHYIRNDI